MPLNIDYRLLYTPQNNYLDKLAIDVSTSLGLVAPLGFNTAKEVEQHLFNHPYLAGINFANISVSYLLIKFKSVY